MKKNISAPLFLPYNKFIYVLDSKESNIKAALTNEKVSKTVDNIKAALPPTKTPVVVWNNADPFISDFHTIVK